MTVYGDGSQTRSLCYVDDEVRGLIALFDSDLTGPVNVGNPDEYTVLELARHGGRTARITVTRSSTTPFRSMTPPDGVRISRWPGRRWDGSRPPNSERASPVTAAAVAEEIGRSDAAPPTAGATDAARPGRG